MIERLSVQLRSWLCWLIHMQAMTGEEVPFAAIHPLSLGFLEGYVSCIKNTKAPG